MAVDMVLKERRFGWAWLAKLLGLLEVDFGQYKIFRIQLLVFHLRQMLAFVGLWFPSCALLVSAVACIEIRASFICTSKLQ